MQGLEEFISGDLFKYFFYGVLIIIQLYIANKIDPIKRSIERLEKDAEKQWEVIDDIRESLNRLQGEHNIKACRGGKK